LLKEGAHILDIGGESTRPGSKPLPLADEMARVLPVLREAVKLGVPISVDTYKPQLMQAALDMGADIINDIWALRWREPGTSFNGMQVVAGHSSCGVCLMHMHLEPESMQLAPMEGDVLAQVHHFLQHQAHALEALGVEKNRITLDPGVGFGKTVAQNFELLARQRELLDSGYPVLAGWSRKSSLGAVTGLEAHERMVPSVAAALLALERGASIVRVHDVKPTVQAIKVWMAMNAVAQQLNN
jgi:dihydropteroate synthase